MSANLEKEVLREGGVSVLVEVRSKAGLWRSKQLVTGIELQSARIERDELVRLNLEKAGRAFTFKDLP